MKLSIGCSDFKKLVEEQYYLVDKSLLIAEILNDAEVVLFTRPRRFGKTLNISMLRYFFDVIMNCLLTPPTKKFYKLLPKPMIVLVKFC